jgi:hypothetical protein
MQSPNRPDHGLHGVRVLVVEDIRLECSSGRHDATLVRGKPCRATAVPERLRSVTARGADGKCPEHLWRYAEAKRSGRGHFTFWPGTAVRRSLPLRTGLVEKTVSLLKFTCSNFTIYVCY